MSFLARGSYVSTIKLSHTYTINNIQNTQTNTRHIPNQSYYYQNQETTRSIIYAQPTTRPTQPPTLQPETLRPAPPQQTEQGYINNKLETTNNKQSFVCGVRRNQLNSVSFIVGGETGKYFILAVN